METGVLRVRVPGARLVLTALAATLVVAVPLQAQEGQLPHTNPKKAAAEEPRPSAVPAPRKEDFRKEPRLLASVAYPSGDAQRVLALWRVDLFPDGVSSVPTLDYPGRGFPPAIALLLVESAWETPTKNKVVWVSYRYLHWGASLRADVVWHPARKAAFVSLWEAFPPQIYLEVHRVDPTKSLTDLPFEKYAHKEDEWKKPANRLFFARTFKQFPDEDRVPVKGRGVLVELNYLLLHGQRDAAQTPPVYFRLNLENQEWSEVLFQESKNPPKKR